MTIRVLCLLLATLLPVPAPVRILFIVGAVVLPYFAVVGANAGREPGGTPSTLLDHQAPRALGSELGSERTREQTSYADDAAHPVVDDNTAPSSGDDSRPA